MKPLVRKAWSHDGGALGPCSESCPACASEREDIARRLERGRLAAPSSREYPRRRPQTFPALMLALFLATPGHAAGLSTKVRSGVVVREAGAIPEMPEAAIAAARSVGLAEGFRIVADRPGDWRRFMLVHGESTFTWPRDTTLFLVCEGREVEATDLFAMTPPLEQRVHRLGGRYATALDPTRLWRVRSNRGTVGTVLFARFPIDSCRTDATGLRVGHTRAGTGRP